MRILLIGNYEPDGQESMQRYAQLMCTGLAQAGHCVTLAEPCRVLNRSGRPPFGIWKWVGYVDKYVLSPPELARAARQADVVHVCDHANSLYVPAQPSVPYVVTCHDLLAVRGAMGEDTDCPTGFAGRQLQRQILKGMGRASALACVSSATLHDAQRLVVGYKGKLVVAPNALSFPFRRLGRASIIKRLGAGTSISSTDSYVLHVGSNLRRKNREGVLKALAGIASSWNGKLVFAGQPLTPQLWRLAAQLGISARIVEVCKPSNELLEALYNGAQSLLFPSRFEGFGWPIIEAQACGCPVVCSRREPLVEVAGDGAILCDCDDPAAFGAAVLELASNRDARAGLIARGLINAKRYDRTVMINQFASLYGRLAAAA